VRHCPSRVGLTTAPVYANESSARNAMRSIPSMSVMVVVGDVAVASSSSSSFRKQGAKYRMTLWTGKTLPPTRKAPSARSLDGKSRRERADLCA
jgi:hypothetical protein